MARYDEIKNTIRENYSALPRNQKKIADYFVEHFDEIPFLNIQDIAKSTHSSDASIVRFAQRCDYEGFKELQEEIGKTLQHRLQQPELFTISSDDRIENDILTSIARQDVKNINDTLSLIERDRFESAVDMILNARHVYTAGLGISYILADLLSYQLSQVGISSSPLRQGSTEFAEQVLFFQPNDLFIAFSFPPYSIETIETARIAHMRNHKVIAITNKANAPITFSATLSLLVRSENMLFTNSFAAISVLINALSTQCALKDKSRAERMLNDLNTLVKPTTIHM